MVSLIGAAIVAVGGVVAALLQKKGKDKAASHLIEVLDLLKEVLRILEGSGDPRLTKVAGDLRKRLRGLV